MMTVEPAVARAARPWRVKNSIGVVVIALILFVGSGDFRWLAGWLYVAMMASIQTLQYLVLLRVAPELMLERSRIQKGTKAWDKVFVPVIAVILPFVIWIVAALDERYRWSRIAEGWQFVGFVPVAAGMTLVTWAMLRNPFLSATVRIQKERHQTVVDRGVAGSDLCAADDCAQALEDRTLRAELDGYTSYALRVRARLIPAVW